MTDLLDPSELGAHLGRFRRRLFRTETLPAYAVDADGDDYQRWLAGEPDPTWERKNRWLDMLRAERAAGKVSSRVRILSERLTDYERYACEWGYALNAGAGEHIRILHRGEHPIPSIIERDFWVIDDDQAVAMLYDERGRFEGADVRPVSELEDYRDVRDAAWAGAEPISDWWARHPELRRRLVA